MMRIRLLGTGAADGWPNPFCRCASCVTQQGRWRTPTSLVIDDRVLVDCGPEAPRQALRCGVDLSRIEAALIGHAHPDHCAPQFLMHREWATTTPFVVAGPEPVVRACRPWLDPARDEVRFVQLTAGDEAMLAGYRVLALPATHHADGEALLYRITSPEGVSVLYATDTGALSRQFEAALGAGRLDAVFLEETFGDAETTPSHHNLVLFEASIERLRASGHVDDNTQVWAIHLGHGNPPEPELNLRLAALGARAGMDGDEIIVGAT